MKKLIFKASFLALATLTIFSSCKKDEVIEPEFEEKARFYAQQGCTVFNTDLEKWEAGIRCDDGYGKCKKMSCTRLQDLPKGFFD